MSVATPVIERNTFAQQQTAREAAVTTDADALHNSRMKNNLARLLNPKNNLQDVVASIDAEGTQVIRTTPVAEEPPAPLSPRDVLYGPRPASKATVTRGIVSANPPASQPPVYMVQNARADAEIFRADNPINRPVYASAPAPASAFAPNGSGNLGMFRADNPMNNQVYASAPAPASAFAQNVSADAGMFRADNLVNRQVYATSPAEAFAAAKAIAAANPAPAQPVAPAVDDENEDLRPTATTIQYQTIGADGAVIIGNNARAKQESEIVSSEEDEEKVSKFSLSRRDKTIIGVIVGLILAVFVLIIVNSAVISNLNNDISMLEDMAQAASTTFNSVVNQFEDLTSYENVLDVAIQQGWIN